MLVNYCNIYIIALSPQKQYSKNYNPSQFLQNKHTKRGVLLTTVLGTMKSSSSLNMLYDHPQFQQLGHTKGGNFAKNKNYEKVPPL